MQPNPTAGTLPHPIPGVRMIEIEKPVSTDSLDAVRSLMREFVAWHRERHAIDIHLVDSYFDPAAFDAELASLPGP